MSNSIANGSFTFNGATFTFNKGDSISAALLRAGTKTIRKTRFQSEPRSMFCGIGICFDCLVEINGKPSQRACVTEVSDGMVIVSNRP